MKHGYYNFEIDPDSQRWTVTVGGGRAIIWRKLVQGFASSGAFFQYAVCKLLGGLVGTICSVYLDDIIVVGATPEACAKNVMTVMTLLNSFRFRINFSKCAFTPSTDIDFLGCSLRGTLVYPGPKVSAMLSKIRPPHQQLTPKGQRHHLHVFLGCCAFVMQHCPGLKQLLSPLYLAVASQPYTYGDNERRAFEASMAALSSLQPYHLPSHDPDVVLELFTDASGGTGTEADPGAWAAALGQRKGVASLENPAEGFELLQLDGARFSAKQAEWDVLKKEAMALFQALTRFRQYLYGRRFRIYTDSKVLMYMFRTESTVIKRWYAYAQTYDFDMLHISSNANALVDCLSRYTFDPVAAPVSGPRLLAAAKSVPAKSLLRCGDVESNPGPNNRPRVAATQVHAQGPLAPAQLVPPPSILDCGDIEANPGPVSPAPSVTEANPDPASPAPSVIDVLSGSSDASMADSPVVAPVADAATTAAARSSRQRAARGGGADQAPQQRNAQLQAESVRVEKAEDIDASQPVVFDSSSDLSAEQVSPLQTVKLISMQIEESANAFMLALSEALRDDHARTQLRHNLAIPFAALEIRERVMWFFETSARQPMSLLFGKSFESSFRDTTPVLSFFHREDTHVPENWSEYCALMADEYTIPDLLFVKAAAIVFSAQIVLFTENDLRFDISPCNAFRRVFLFASNEAKHYNWGRVALPDDAQVDAAHEWTFDAPELRATAAHVPSPQAFSNGLDISDDKLRLMHAAHNAYNGHPGVEATVRQLWAMGHKWRRMTAHVTQFIKRCPTCCSSRSRLAHAPVSAATVRLHARPLRRWHIDQTGTMGDCMC